jgi:nicotinamide mononucleotide transporter
MGEIVSNIIDSLQGLSILEFAGLVFGVINVLLLIREDIRNWIFGILYILVSFVIFWQSRLYGDFILHVIYLVLNIYGWYNWTKPKEQNDLAVTLQSFQNRVIWILVSLVGVVFFAQFLLVLPTIFPNLDPPSLPYWDSTTTMLSVTAMWLTARKKLESWVYWLVVDVLATGIYFYKGLYFYSLLYFIYIAFAVMGYRAWLKSYRS